MYKLLGYGQTMAAMWHGSACSNETRRKNKMSVKAVVSYLEKHGTSLGRDILKHFDLDQNQGVRFFRHSLDSGVVIRSTIFDEAQGRKLAEYRLATDAEFHATRATRNKAVDGMAPKFAEGVFKMHDPFNLSRKAS